MPNGSPGVSDFAEGQYLDPMCMRPWWYLWKTGGDRGVLAFAAFLELANAVVVAWCPRTLIFCSFVLPTLLPASELFPVP